MIVNKIFDKSDKSKPTFSNYILTMKEKISHFSPKDFYCVSKNLQRKLKIYKENCKSGREYDFRIYYNQL